MRLLLTIIPTLILGCGNAAGQLPSSNPNISHADDGGDSASNSVPIPDAFVFSCPAGYQSCGDPLVVCCDGHCGETDAGVVCLPGTYVLPCDSNCKSLPDATDDTNGE